MHWSVKTDHNQTCLDYMSNKGSHLIVLELFVVESFILKGHLPFKIKEYREVHLRLQCLTQYCV